MAVRGVCRRKDLEAEVRRRLRGEIELWGRRNRFAELQLIPVSALDGLRLNFAERTADDQAAGERPVLYDLHLKQVGQKATESARDDLHLKEVGQKAAESARAEGTREQPKRKVGRKPEFDWDALHTEFFRRIDDNGLPDNVSAFTRSLLEWYEQQFGRDKAPDFETAYDYVKKWIGGWDRSLPRT